MQQISPPRPARRSGSLVGGALLGAGLVAAGLGLAFLTVETPLVARLVSGGWAGSGRLPFAAVLGLLGLVGASALLVAGTDRLAVIVATVRSSVARGPSFARALEALGGDVDVVNGVVPHDGRPIPSLVVGPFGVAIVDEMGPTDRLRRIGESWEARTRDGWQPTEHPLDRAARDAERVRRWLNHGELDFVVRVYVALVTPDGTIPRSPLCAVLTVEQIPAWIGALPRQRSLSDGRRNLVLARARAAADTGGRKGDW